MQHARQSFGIHFLLLFFMLSMVNVTGHAENGLSVAPATSIGGDIDRFAAFPIPPRRYCIRTCVRAGSRTNGASLPA